MDAQYTLSGLISGQLQWQSTKHSFGAAKVLIAVLFLFNNQTNTEWG